MEVDDKAAQINTNPPPIQPIHAVPGTSESMNVERFVLGDTTMEFIRDNVSRPQHCEAAEMLRFLFSFCGTSGDAADVERKEEFIKLAFKQVQELANKEVAKQQEATNENAVKTKGSPLVEYLNQAIVANDEESMCLQLLKAFNYALDELSQLDIPGLPLFQESSQVVFLRNHPEHIAPEIYLKEAREPGIVLMKWDFFKERYGNPNIQYSMTHESPLCGECDFSKLRFDWKCLLSTVEVNLGPSKTSGDGEKVSGDKSETGGNFAEYSGDFGELRGDRRAAKSSKPPKSPQPTMPPEGYPIEPIQFRSSSREGDDSNTDEDLLASTTQRKRRKTFQKGQPPKKPKCSDSMRPSETDEGVEETNDPAELSERLAKLQSAMYATHKISSSFNNTHMICFILIGTSVFLTWIDRQGVIESRVIDLVDELPHFLLLLLILQRFGDAKWGCLAECPESGVKMEMKNEVSTASFVAAGPTGQEREIIFYPDADNIHLGTSLVGRGTSVIGGRTGPAPDDTQLHDRKKLRDANNIAVKIYWPEEARTSEVEILKKAEECGNRFDFIKNHIPEVVCHRDPEFLCGSTKVIRQFLGLPTDGCRRLRIVAFRRLRQIRELKERDMLTGYLECFFCHFFLWKMGIRHGDISPTNLMWDDERKVGVLNDFDFAKCTDQMGLDEQDHTGTLAFTALDLVSGLGWEIPHLYRHEAEAFAWSLIYMCLVTVEEDGENYAMSDPNPLAGWFGEWEDSFHAKIALQWHHHNNSNTPFAFPNIITLAFTLRKYWKDRFEKQFLDEVGLGIPFQATVKDDFPDQEPGDNQVFEEVLMQISLGLEGQEEKELVDGMEEKYRAIVGDGVHSGQKVRTK